jgi:hypothetical protein
MPAYSCYALVSNDTENSDSSSFEAFTSSSSSSFNLDIKSSFEEELYLHLYNDTFDFDFNFDFEDESPLLPPLEEANIKALAKSFAPLIKKEHSLVARA